MRKILLFLACLAVSAPAFAQVTCYAITPSTSGSGTGASWTNAHGGFPTLVRGTRYYVADGAYASSPSLGTAVSGTTIIELRKAQSYDFGRASDGCSNDISSGWSPSTMGSAQARWTTAWSIGTSYLTLSGNGNSTGPGCGGAYGSNIAVGTVTGSPDCGFVIDNTSGGIGTTRPMGFSGNNNTVEYFEIRQDGNNNSNFTIFGGGSGSSGNPNILSHLYLHYAGCVFLQDLGDYVTVDESYFWGTEVNGGSSCHGQAEFEVGNTNHGTRTNSVYRDISGTAVWTFAATTGTGTNFLWYNNIVFFSPYGQVTATTGSSGTCPANCLSSTGGDNVGSSFSPGQAIYLGGSTPGASTVNTVSTIYSPTLLSLTTTPSTTGATHFYSVNFGGLSDAVWDCINGDTCNNWEMDQNTVVNCHPGGAQVNNSCGNVGAVYYDSGSGGNGNFNFRNNLAYNITGSYSFSQAGSTFTANTDHNSYLNSPTPSCSSCTNVGGDVHVASGAANPFVAWPSNAANFALASDNANYNNRTTGSLIPPADITGTTFTTDRGAYQFGTPSQATQPTCTPAAGTYFGTQTASCSNPNGGTTVMCWSVTTTPVTNSLGTGCTTGTKYTTTIPISTTETLKVVAGTSTLADSPVASYAYTINTTAPLTVTVTGTSTDTVTDNLSILTGCNGSTSPCSANYTPGTVVTLTATAGSGQSFSGWSGSGCSGTGTCVVTMSAAESVTATFAFTTSFALTVTETGSGAVTSSPSGINCPGTCSANFASGTNVTLTAVASPGNLFINWSTCSFSGTCAVSMTAAQAVTANFCMPVAPAYCNNQTFQSTSFSIASNVVTINASNTAPSGAYIGLSQFTHATQLNGRVLKTNGSTTPTKLVGTLFDVHGTALTPANVSNTADTTGFMQGQGWNPFYTAPFPAPGSINCPLGNGDPICTPPTSASGWTQGINTWAFDFAVPCGVYGLAPCVPYVQLADPSFTAGHASMLPSAAGETNERNISLSDGSTPPNYMYGLKQDSGAVYVFSGHLDPTYCNGTPCFVSDVQGIANAWTQLPLNYGLFSRNPADNPGPNKHLFFALNLSATCGISGSPDCSIAPVLQKHVLQYSAGTVSEASGYPQTVRAMNTCPGYAHLQVGGGLGISSQIQIDNFDNHLLVSVEGGSQGAIQHHSVFVFTNLNSPSANLCEEWDTGGYAGTNLGEIQVTAAHGGSSYAVNDTFSFTEAAGVCSSTGTVTAISGSAAKTVAIASGASSGCYLARGFTTTATSGSGTGLEIDVAGVGTSGTNGTYYAPITAAACPAGNNTTLTCESPSTTAVASAGIHNCAMQMDPTSTAGCGGPNPMLGEQWNPGDFSSFTIATNTHLSGHGQPGYAWTGNAANPSIFEHKGLAGLTDTSCTNVADCYNLYTLPNGGCAGAIGGVQMHGMQPVINNDDLQPVFITSSINSPGVPTQTNPPGFVCAFGQQSLFSIAKSPSPGIIPGVPTWLIHWYENTNNGVLANGPIENFEGLNNIMACAPDVAFCIVAMDSYTNFAGNTGLGLDGGGAAFVGAFSVTLPSGAVPPAPPLGMFANVKASILKERTDEALSSLFRPSH